MVIEVYTSKVCSMCVATKAWLKRNGFQFNEFDVLEDRDAFERCKALGYTELPVVVADDDHWSGFRYGKLKDLLKKVGPQ